MEKFTVSVRSERQKSFFLLKEVVHMEYLHVWSRSHKSFLSCRRSCIYNAYLCGLGGISRPTPVGGRVHGIFTCVV